MNDISGEIRYFPGHSTSENQHATNIEYLIDVSALPGKIKSGKFRKIITFTRAS